MLHVLGGGPRLEYPPGKILKEALDVTSRVRFSPDGRHVALGGPVDGLTVLDGSGAERWSMKTLPVSGLAWAPDGEALLVTSASGPGTEVLSISGQGKERRILSLPGRFVLHDVTRGGRLLLSRVLEDVEALFLPPGEARERSLSWLDISIPADLSSDGGRLLFTEEGAGVGWKSQVFVRSADGSPAVRLGNGVAKSLSPDGRWAVTVDPASTTTLRLLPTGPGEPREVGLGTVRCTGEAALFPDGRSLLFSGSEAGKPTRLFVRSLDDGSTRFVTHEDVALPTGHHGLAPDGQSVVARDERSGRWTLFSIAKGSGDAGRMLAAIQPGEDVLQWSSDGRSLFVLTPAGRVDRVDPTSGRREALRDLRVTPGFRSLEAVVPARDGRSCVYALRRRSSDLFVADGVR